MTARDRVPVALLGAAAVASLATLLVLAHPLSFIYDEWDFLLGRRDWDANAFLDPHNEHLSLVPVLLYKLGVTAFGMTSQLPFQLLLTGSVLAVALGVFVFVRDRLGAWLAFAAALPLLFFGAGGIDLLWPFQIMLVGSLALGVGALVALDRDTPGGDRAACVLLCASIATGSPGLAFAFGIAIGILISPDRRRRAYVFVVPLALYAAWWLGWGSGEGQGPTLDEIVHSPVFVLNGFASSLASLVGLVVGLDGETIDPLRWGRPLLVVALAAAAWRLWRVRRISPSLATVLGIGVSFWGLVALAGGGLARQPNNPRYLLLGAVFVILIAAELWRGSRPGRATIGVALALAALSVVGNLTALLDVHRFLEGTANGYRAALGAAEIAGDRADPAATPIPPVTLGPYLDAVKEYGSPAFDSDELVASPESVRIAADRTLAGLYGIEATPTEVAASGLRAPGAGGSRDGRVRPAGDRRGRCGADGAGPAAIRGAAVPHRPR